MPHEAHQSVLVGANRQGPGCKGVAGGVRLAVLDARRLHRSDPYPALEQFGREGLAVFHGEEVVALCFCHGMVEDFTDGLARHGTEPKVPQAHRRSIRLAKDGWPVPQNPLPRRQED